MSNKDYLSRNSQRNDVKFSPGKTIGGVAGNQDLPINVENADECSLGAVSMSQFHKTTRIYKNDGTEEDEATAPHFKGSSQYELFP